MKYSPKRARVEPEGDLMGKNNSVTSSGTQGQKSAELVKVCLGCKKRYDEIRGWIPCDPAVYEDGSVLLSHALCSECKKRMYPGYV